MTASRISSTRSPSRRSVETRSSPGSASSASRPRGRESLAPSGWQRAPPRAGPTAGEVAVNGKPAHQARLDQDYGMAFQQAGLFEWRTVAKNIELPLELR